MIRVVADMASDLFHSGHVSFLKQAKQCLEGNDIHLTIALHTDEQIASYKQRYPVQNFESRKSVLLSCRYVDAVMEAPDDFDDDFEMKFDFLVHGDDLLRWDEELLEKFYGRFITGI